MGTEQPHRSAAPVLKWAGGKRQLLEQIAPFLPARFSAYYEPFVGGGALLFHLLPPRAVINDINTELITLYTVIKTDVEQLIATLAAFENGKQRYYEIRDWDRDGERYAARGAVERAARMVYLNKTCYNGLFRVNRAGHFNTPYGRYENPNIVDSGKLRAVSAYFNQARVEMLCGDYGEVLRGVEDGALVYFDPPYDPVSMSANFTGYAKGGFGREEQVRLKAVCDWLTDRGVRFLLSNSATEFIRELYGRYTMVELRARRSVNSHGRKRGEVKEILVMNYSLVPRGV